MAQSSRLGAHFRAHHDIQLTIVEGERLRIFQLSAQDERVVTVGSAPGADIQFDTRDVSPIHFYFERVANEIWLVPAYCVSGLSVDQNPVSAPQKLRSRSCLEFGEIRLDVELARPPADDANTASDTHRDVRGPSGPSNPEDDEPTHQVWTTADDGEQSCEFGLIPTTAAARALPPRVLTLIQKPPVLPPADSELNGDAPCEALVPVGTDLPRPAQSPARVDTTRTVQISVVRAVSSSIGREPAPRFNANAPFRSPLPCADVPSLKKTLYGVSPSLFGTDNALLAAQRPGRCITRVVETRTAPVRPRNKPSLPRRRASLLTWLGRHAKRKPVFVGTIAVLSALLGALLVVAVASAAIQKRGGPLNLGLHEITQPRWIPAQ